MGKQGEVEYLKKLGAEGRRHAADKPFSDHECGKQLMDLAAILSLLPPPPARLLDLGVGTGWTSCFFARRGYEVVGQDICTDMIIQAENNRERYGQAVGLDFVVSDYESLGYDAEFDCAVFFDSLHHAVDERAALAAVCRALKPNGICITSEPGVGHARMPYSVRAVEEFGVTEKDMPPTRIIPLAREVGFTTFRLYPHLSRLAGPIYRGPGFSFRWSLRGWAWSLFPRWLARRRGGIVVLQKGTSAGVDP